MEKVYYSIKIDRPGVADLPELCTTDTAAAAAEVIRAILAANDRNIVAVTVSVVRGLT